MKNTFLFIIGLIVAALLLAWSSLYVVKPKQIAVVQRFGEIINVRTESGFYFKMPFSMFQMDNMLLLSSQLRRLDLDTIQVQVRGGRYYSVDAFLVYRINNARLYVEQGGTNTRARGVYNGVESKLQTIFESSLRAVYGTREFNAALSEERAVMMKEVLNQVAPQAKGLGLDIADVRIQRTDLSLEVSQQTFDRMKQERLVEAEKLTADGQIQRQTIEADAERQRTHIIATATKDADILRGQGEAESARIMGEAAARNPNFFEFWLKMMVFQQSLPNAQMVISSDSDFSRYFQPGAPVKNKSAMDNRAQ